MSMDELQGHIGTWAEETFGHAPGKLEDMPALIAHMRDQLDKLEQQPERAMERLADIAILAFTGAHVQGKSLEISIIAKHTVNRVRELLPASERGG